jgi:hypothetical protein
VRRDLAGVVAALGAPGVPSAAGTAGRWRDLPPPEHDPDEARRAADHILARPEYQWDDGSRDPISRLADWLAEQLNELLGATGSQAVLPAWVGWLVLMLLVGLIVLVVYRNRHHLWRDRVTERAADHVVVDEGEADVDWAAEAERNEASGRWREGLRCRYRALIGALAERDVIADLVGRTAGEYARDVAARCPPASPAFAAATELFERACYGGADTGPAERDRFAAAAADVLAAVAASPAARRPEVVVPA